MRGERAERFQSITQEAKEESAIVMHTTQSFNGIKTIIHDSFLQMESNKKELLNAEKMLDEAQQGEGVGLGSVVAHGFWNLKVRIVFWLE